MEKFTSDVSTFDPMKPTNCGNDTIQNEMNFCQTQRNCMIFLSELHHSVITARVDKHMALMG